MTLPEGMELSNTCVDFMLKCLVKEQEERPEVSEMLKHSWVTAEGTKVSNEAQVKVIDSMLQFRD